MSTILHLQRYISNSFDTRLLLFSGLAAAGVGALGSLFGGLFGKKGSDKANQMNLQIARETNQANRENQEYQNAWNLEQWNRENEYNSPLEKRKRLEAAGLNPIFYGLDGVANAGSLQSAPFTAVNGAPMLNSGEFLGNSIANAAKTAAEIELMRSQAKKNDAERSLTEVETETKKMLQKGEFEIQGVVIDGLRKENDIKDETIKNLVSERSKLEEEAKEIQDRVISRKRDLDIKDFIARANKAYQDEVVVLEKRKLDQRDKEIEISDRRLAFDIAIGWAKKVQGDTALDIEQGKLDNEVERTNWQSSNIYSEIQSRDSLLPYIMRELQAKINNLDAETAMKTANFIVRLIDAIIPG